MSTLSTANIQSKAVNTPPVIKDLNGTECGQFIKAWVNFDGSTGTAGQNDVTIRSSFNVSSVTDTAVGRYTVNFTNAFANANYIAAGNSGNITSTTATERSVQRDGLWTTTAAQIRVVSSTSTAQDDSFVGIMFIGD